MVGTGLELDTDWTIFNYSPVQSLDWFNVFFMTYNTPITIKTLSISPESDDTIDVDEALINVLRMLYFFLSICHFNFLYILVLNQSNKIRLILAEILLYRTKIPVGIMSNLSNVLKIFCKHYGSY